MAEPYIANIVGQFQQGQAFGTQQRQAREAEQRQSRLSELSSLAYGAQNPEERRSLVGQAIATDPTAGLALGGSLAKDDESQQMELVKAIRLVGMYPEAQQPEAYRRVVGQLRQRFPGLPIPDEIDDNARKALAAVNSAYGGGDQSDVKVVGNALVNSQGQAIYEAPQLVPTDQGYFTYTPSQGFRPAGALPAQVGDIGEVAPGSGFRIGADIPPEVAAGITAQETDAGGVPLSQPPQARPILPRGAGAEQERLRLAREANDRAIAAERRAQEAADRAARGSAPAGFRFRPDNTLEPIPGGPKPAGAAATEGERTAATLLRRLEFSEKQLEQATKERPSAASPSALAETARALPFVGNVAARKLNSSERQRVESAQLDILDAALTLGTGAAYTREQLEGYRSSYFPEVGDSAENIRDKAARLKNIIESAKIKAGRAAPESGGGMGGGPAPAPAPQRARNPQTGQVIELRNGQWVPVDG